MNAILYSCDLEKNPGRIAESYMISKIKESKASVTLKIELHITK